MVSPPSALGDVKKERLEMPLHNAISWYTWQRMTPKILAFAGSTRQGSYNKMLLKIAAAGATQAGADVTVVDLKDFPMPLYDGDFQKNQGLPDTTRKLKQMMIDSDGFLIATPEYNGSISGVLKNTIDWVSRTEGSEGSLAAFTGKTAVVMGASDGRLGAVRSVTHLAYILWKVGTLVLPDYLALPFADEAFDDKGRLKDASSQAKAESLGTALAEFLAKHR